MSALTIERLPEFSDPVLIVSFSGWNDAGSAATHACQFLVKKMRADRFASIDPEELNFVPRPDQNDRSSKHLGSEEFDKKVHEKYLTHININNLKGLKIELIYEWKVGESLIVDRSHIHCASTRIKHKKLGLTTFTKK